MFRVPVDADRPTFDHTFKVSFWGWLTSKGPVRREWMRRRTAAARLAERHQYQAMGKVARSVTRWDRRGG